MTSNRLLYGSDEPLPSQVPLRAGPLTMLFEAGDLRYISLGSRELVRRIYGAVRDHDWKTIRPVFSALAVDAAADSFHIRYQAEHRDGDVDFVWQAAITGHADGVITFAFSGEARSTFLKNRIGLCTLHPMRECAGLPARARHAGGTESEVTFPSLVSVEQPVIGFSDLRGLTYDAGTGARVELTFEGDIFETEDQRNWIDASYKTYSTPIAAPRPAQVLAGTRIEQQVTVRLAAATPITARASTSAATVELEVVDESIVRRMPAIGFSMGSGAELDSTDRIERLRAMRPAFLRVDLDLTGDWRPKLARGLSLCRRLGCELEAAIDLTIASGAELQSLRGELATDVSLARVLVYAAGSPSTTSDVLQLAREQLGVSSSVPEIGVGTRMDLYQIHLFPPPESPLLNWTMNPQAHSWDVTSLSETPSAAGEQVRTVLGRHRDAHVAVGPVTLGPREWEAGKDAAVHPLYGSHFAAAWTLAMIKHLAEAGASSVTLFNRLDVVASDTPLSAILPALCLSAGDVLTPIRASHDGIAALFFRRSDTAILFLSNLTRDEQRVRVPANLALPGDLKAGMEIALQPFSATLMRLPYEGDAATTPEPPSRSG